MVSLLFPVDSNPAVVFSVKSFMASASCFKRRLGVKVETHMAAVFHQQNHLRTQRPRVRGLIMYICINHSYRH